MQVQERPWAGGRRDRKRHCLDYKKAVDVRNGNLNLDSISPAQSPDHDEFAHGRVRLDGHGKLQHDGIDTTARRRETALAAHPPALVTNQWTVQQENATSQPPLWPDWREDSQ
jgi:hypothetical protein